MRNKTFARKIVDVSTTLAKTVLATDDRPCVSYGVCLA